MRWRSRGGGCSRSRESFGHVQIATLERETATLQTGTHVARTSAGVTAPHCHWHGVGDPGGSLGPGGAGWGAALPGMPHHPSASAPALAPTPAELATISASVAIPAMSNGIGNEQEKTANPSKQIIKKIPRMKILFYRKNQKQDTKREDYLRIK